MVQRSCELEKKDNRKSWRKEYEQANGYRINWENDSDRETNGAPDIFAGQFHMSYRDKMVDKTADDLDERRKLDSVNLCMEQTNWAELSKEWNCFQAAWCHQIRQQQWTHRPMVSDATFTVAANRDRCLLHAAWLKVPVDLLSSTPVTTDSSLEWAHCWIIELQPLSEWILE